MRVPEAEALQRIPACLRDENRWVSWKRAPAKEPGKKPRKLPINPKTGKAASSTDPSTWGSFAEALNYAQSHGLDGVGFMLEGSVFTGFDWDDCRDPESGTIDAGAHADLELLQTYSEISPSGRGLRAIAKGKLPPGGRKKKHIEMYDSSRYLTFTGARLEDFPATVEERTGEIALLHARHFGAKEAKRKSGSGASSASRDISDDEVLRRAFSSKHGDCIRSLFRGELGDHSSDSEATAALLFHLAFWTGKNADQMDRLFRRSGLIRPKWDSKRRDGTWGSREIQHAIEMCSDIYREPAVAQNGHEPETDRPRIEVIPGQIHNVVELAEGVLLREPEPVVFQREGRLVRIVRLPENFESGGVRRNRGSAVLRELDAPYLVKLLTRAADWLVPSGKGMRTHDAPERVAKILLASQGDWRQHRLTGVVYAPTLRADGTLLERPGYDRSSGLYFDSGGVNFGSLSKTPSRSDALEAWRVFDPVFGKFPYVSPADAVVPLTAVMTGLVRRILRTAPCFLFCAPSTETGKTLLANTIGIVVSGFTPSVMSQGQDETEDKKRYLSILLEGDIVATIDNIDRPFESAALCSILTSSLYKDRLLSKNEMGRAPTNILWLGTGNNVIVKGDLVTRTVLCHMDAGIERPGMREFEIDLHEYVPAHRVELVRAALTILLAYQHAGRPPQPIPPYGQFEEWSKLVRSAVVWLGLPDPLESAARLVEREPIRAGLHAVLAAWHVRLRAAECTAASVIREIDGGKLPELRAALDEVLGGVHGQLDARTLGTYLAGHEGRLVGGLRFVRAGVTHGVSRWRVDAAGGDQGGPYPHPSREKEREECAGEMGGVPTPPDPPQDDLGSAPSANGVPEEERE